MGVGGGVGWRSEGGREVSLSFSPRQLLLSKSVLVIRQAVSCCLVLVPRVLESPLSGISPGDLFVVFPSFDCFFSLGFFQSFDYKCISWWRFSELSFSHQYGE